MPPLRPLHGINGRLRQHIHGLGRHYAVGRWSSRAKKPTPDDFLNELIESGELTEAQLRALVDEVQSNYRPYSFLGKFSDRILDKADDVFWAKHGRNPHEHEWRGEFRQICQRLKSHPRSYDDVLDRAVAAAAATAPSVSQRSHESDLGHEHPTAASEFAVLQGLLREVLGDVIPAPKREHKKNTFFSGEFTYPTYKVTLRSFAVLPDCYTGDSRTDRRIHERLEGMRRETRISYGATGKYNRYVEIARIPTFLVKKVECRTKHEGPWEASFVGHGL